MGRSEGGKWRVGSGGWGGVRWEWVGRSEVGVGGEE